MLDQPTFSEPIADGEPVPFPRALRTYLRERFPIAKHGLLIGFLFASAVCYGALVSGTMTPPRPIELLAGYVTLLLTFLLMRLLDEIKDAQDDAKYRPYRPVPRGLISLRAIGALAAFTVLVQFLLQWLWLPEQLVFLAAVYSYLGLMTFEFGVPAWLRRRPLVYAASHMLIMPLIGVYALTIGALEGEAWAAGVPYFLLLLFAGFVIEIGRKVRSPDGEEIGVETYSAAYGVKRAALMWLGAVVITCLIGVWILDGVAFSGALTALLVAGCLCCAAIARAVVRLPTRSRAKRIELASGVWSLLLFGSVATGAGVHQFVGAA
jgi:4-hydroxybenzoate polyprenyltransferase